MDLIGETHGHGLSESLPVDQLFAMLVTRLRGVAYSKPDVRSAVEFLCSPLIGAGIGDGSTGIALAMNRATLARTLRAAALKIEELESETEE